MNLGDKVRQRREELGLSQEQLANAMGYSSRSSINKIENGRPCTQKIIVRLADALNVSIPYLMGWEEKESSPEQISLSEGEALLLELFRAIPEQRQEMVLSMIRAALGQQNK